MIRVYFFLLGIVVFSCNNSDTLEVKDLNKLNDEPIILDGHYMQYACGIDNDDMKINYISDTTFKYLIGNDIDPVFLNGKEDLGDFFYKNRNTNTEYLGLGFKIKGYLSKSTWFGCDNGAPKFWITEIWNEENRKLEIHL